jgi:hypothetical protein
MEEGVLLELTFYGKLRFRQPGEFNLRVIASFIILGICFFLIMPWLIGFLAPSGDKWYSYIPAILVLIGGITIKVSKALIEKQNYLQITSDHLSILDNNRIVYKKFDFKDVYWFDYTNKETEDGMFRRLMAVTDNKAEYFELDQFQEKQIEKLISKLQELNLDVRYYDY